MNDPSVNQQDNENTATPVSNGYRRYVLVLLTLVYALNFIDRQILVILQESIKVDMDLSDSQLGLLTGFAFAIFYVSVGIPIARWADVGNRRNIVSLAVAVWSGMTALSGFTQNFWQLLMARIGVGVGEAGGSPPSHSMISDYYPVEQRGSALSFYSTGVYLGILFGFLIGGWINSEFGWRVAFFVVGVPGFLVALLVRLTIREPVRGGLEGRALEVPATFGETLRTLRGFGSFKLFAIGAGLNAFSSYGIGNFTPSFLIRSHGFSSLEVGTSLALITGIGGALGTYMGGVLADRFGANDKRWYLWIAAIPGALSVPLMFTAVFIGDPQWALGFLFFATMLGAFYLGPTIAISHTMVSPSMRAMASAILFFILNLIGLGLGPLVVGMLSDLLAPTYGSESLRYALGMVSFVNLISATFFVLAARKLLADLK
ncbi:MAG: MFS transporter [Porticoccaceae bacterium]|jgi:MFS family permease|nr:MFS transporter [Porticoccaceae bacterium]